MNPAPSTATPTVSLITLADREDSDLEPARDFHERRVDGSQRCGIRVVEHALRRLDPTRGDEVRGHRIHVLDVCIVERRIERELVPDRLRERLVLLRLL